MVNFFQGTINFVLRKTSVVTTFGKDLIFTSIQCNICGWEKKEIQSIETEPKGCSVVLSVRKIEDLKIRIVISSYTRMKLGQAEFQIQGDSNKVELISVGAVIDKVIHCLKQKLPVINTNEASQIENYIDVLMKFKLVQSQFEIELVDISGNCFVDVGNSNTRCETTYYIRTRKEDELLGIYEEKSNLQGIGNDSDVSPLNLLIGDSSPEETKLLKQNAELSNNGCDVATGSKTHVHKHTLSSMQSSTTTESLWPVNPHNVFNRER